VKQLQLVFSDAAVVDIMEQADWYAAQSGRALSRRWERSVTSSLMRVIRNPALGRRCAFRSAELRDVRRMGITGFPKHLLFYKLEGVEVLILRVVHGARDLERLF
jgi:toxin ParE1/3/4